MEETTFWRFVFVFSIRKTKRQVSGLSFWFENEIVDIVLSNRFRKQNDAKRKFPFISKMKRNKTTIKKSKHAQQHFVRFCAKVILRKIWLYHIYATLFFVIACNTIPLFRNVYIINKYWYVFLETKISCSHSPCFLGLTDVFLFISN